MLDDQLKSALERRRAKGTLRQLTVFSTQPSSSSSTSSACPTGPQSHHSDDTEAAAGNSRLIDFSSNDYLSLSSCPQVRRDFIDAFTSSPDAKLGSTGSRLLDGNSAIHERLERELVHHFDAPSGLLFNSGYEANVSIFSTLLQPHDIVLFDSLVHASVHDGIRRSRTSQQLRLPFQHNSARDLDRILRELQQRGQLTVNRNVWLAVESVYSMDGDLCPLPALLDVLSGYLPNDRICAVVDEAHSTGLYGRQGRGFVHSLGLHRDSRIKARLMTFGKAMGASGAVVLCSETAKQFLINYARPLIFSTALGYPALFALEAVIKALQDKRGEQRAQSTFHNSCRLVSGLNSFNSTQGSQEILSLPQHLLPGQSGAQFDAASMSATIDDDHITQTLASPSPIIPLLTPHARSLAAYLRQNGLLARPICYPTVPRGEDRVRICLHADNTPRDVDRLIACVAQWVRSQQHGPSTPASSSNIASPMLASKL